MKKLKDYTNEEIAKMVLFTNHIDAEHILKEAFPHEKISVRVFSNSDAYITIGERKITIKANKVEE